MRHFEKIIVLFEAALEKVAAFLLRFIHVRWLC